MGKHKADAERIEVEATMHFRHDRAEVRPGDRLSMTPSDAADYEAAGYVQRAPYRDRALRTSAR